MFVFAHINPGYDVVDRVLAEIKEKVSYSEEEAIALIDNYGAYFMAKGLMERYRLVEFSSPYFKDARLSITKEGVKAIEAGGIREYIADFDEWLNE